MPDYFSCRTVINVINTYREAYACSQDEENFKRMAVLLRYCGKRQMRAVSQFGDYIALSQFIC